MWAVAFHRKTLKTSSISKQHQQHQHSFAKMDLMCNEKEMFKDHHHHQVDNHMQQMLHIEPQVNTASADPTFLSERCLENLLKSEETHPSLINFYNNPQCEITPKMRRIVAEWMMEVSFQFYTIFFTQRLFFSIIIVIKICANYAIVSYSFD